MAAITAQLVKELREKTGVGMMDCKTALTESKGDFEAAVDWLRAKGLAKAAKKADRIAAEGLIGVMSDGKSGAIVEVNSETDFVARNPEFQHMVGDIAKLAVKAGGDLEKLQDMQYPKLKQTVADVVKEKIATIGENMNVRRTSALKVKEGVVASYVHSQIAPGLGKIGVLVAIESSGKAAALNELGRKVAMHIAATNPLALTSEQVAKDVVDRERSVFTEQAKESGKPANIVEKMVEGRVKKFFQEVVLLQQAFVIDPDVTVEQAVKAAEKDAGGPIKLTGFVRFGLGEGIEKKEGDFAAEVAAAAGGGKPKAEAPAAETSKGKNGKKVEAEPAKKPATKSASASKPVKSEPASPKAAAKDKPSAPAKSAAPTAANPAAKAKAPVPAKSAPAAASKASPAKAAPEKPTKAAVSKDNGKNKAPAKPKKA